MKNILDHYSVSSVTLASNCPRAWWAKYVLKLDTAPSVAASFGTQYDQLVAQSLKCNDHKGYEHIVPLEGVQEAVQGYLCQPHAFKTATDSQVSINITPTQWAVLAEMHGFYAGIERPIIGFIDLWDAKNRRIVDLKTSSSKRTTYNWALQVLIYSLAMQAASAGIHLMTRTKTPAYYEFIVPINRESTTWAMTLMTDQINQIEGWLKNGAGDELPRRPDYWCSWCPEALTCPATNLILGG